MDNPFSGRQATTPTYPARRHGWWMVTLLFCAAALSNIDRLLLSVLIDPLKADLHITDLRASLLTGPAYGLCYAAFGLILGIAVDRGSRRMLLASGVLLWSMATIGSGLATSFWQLFIARALVGLGEAAVVPSAASVLADFFPRHLRGRPIALYLVGASFGGGLAAWLPGLVASYGLRFEHLPAWRMCFILSGLAGPIVAGLLLTTMEPRRQGGRVGSDVFSGLNGAGRLLNRNRLVFAGIYIGFALFLLTTIAVAGWGPAFLMRSFHLSPSNIGSGLGVGLTIAGVAGYFLAGLAVDLPRLQHPSGRLSVLIFACIVALPVTLCASATTPTIGILLLCSVTFAAPMVYVAASALLQDLVPNDMRGFAVALNSMLGTVVAFSGGPLLVSLLTDHVFHDETKVGVAIGIVTAPALLLSAAAYGLALHGLKRRSPLAGIEAHAILATEPTI